MFLEYFEGNFNMEYDYKFLQMIFHNISWMPGSVKAPVREKRDTIEMEGPGQVNPWRLSGTWVQAEGGKGGRTDKEQP